ncbi:uncharacterized protein F5147DRAFT_647314 [Suillus discolor]|uniref:Uncharacterized protein n=1 Tax=Suillus discolor TaxID=1912936 RepID=A0A9P7K1E0_9AGAM|nr:uncharacterized protein F5147DRAFT_647314 [Suillus discolor]KAG2120936.1 hypothetical protein F5147DRAFT_647314 [Suillus discolor]
MFTDSLAANLIQWLGTCHLKVTEGFEPFTSKYNIKPSKSDPQMSASVRSDYMKKCRSILFDLLKEGLYTNFLHGYKITGNTVNLLMFGNKHLIEGHIHKWYDDVKLPLCDEIFKCSLTMTPIVLLAWSAVALQVLINHIVDLQTARFTKMKYAGWHSELVKDMEHTLLHPIHKEVFKAHLLDTHLKGMEKIVKSLNDLSVGITYIPSSAEEIS